MSEYVIIATLESDNEKTGNMIQIWSLVRVESPLRAVKSGRARAVCFDCPALGEYCYVDLSRAPLGIWKAYHHRKYPRLNPDQYAQVFHGRRVRFGAYGESVLLPFDMMRAIAEASDGWTGYTHQWRRPEFQPYRAYVMASCDTAQDTLDAAAMGWRRFRVRSESDPLLTGEITCPASKEAGHRTHCVDCLLCDGMQGESDARKSIAIIVHGIGARNFESLIQIGGIQ